MAPIGAEQKHDLVTDSRSARKAVACADRTQINKWSMMFSALLANRPTDRTDEAHDALSTKVAFCTDSGPDQAGRPAPVMNRDGRGY
jgi:hypothetical protein